MIWSAVSALFFLVASILYVAGDDLLHAQYFLLAAILVILYAIYDELRKRSNGY